MFAGSWITKISMKLQNYISSNIDVKYYNLLFYLERVSFLNSGNRNDYPLHLEFGSPDKIYMPSMKAYPNLIYWSEFK